MKWLQEDENIKSYTPPVLKAALSVLSIVLLFLSFPLTRHISENYPFVDIVIKIVNVAILYISVLRIYISFGEILALAERREEAKKANLNTKAAATKGKNVSVDSIISLLESNDIIEIWIVAKNQNIKLGASSDSKQGSSKFFDKAFYIGDNDNVTIEDLRKELDNYAIEGKVCVFEIDGVSPNSYPKLR